MLSYIISMRTNEEQMYLIYKESTLKSVLCIFWVDHGAYFEKVGQFLKIIAG